MAFYHGTTKENLIALLHKKDEPISCWNCSDRDGMLYFYDSDKLLKCGEIEEDDHSRAIINAFENAQIQAAFKGIPTDLYVLELDIPADTVQDDFSCDNMSDNMSDYASCTPTGNISAENIVRIFKCEFNHWHAPFVLSGCVDREYFNSHLIDEALLQVTQALSTLSKESILDDIFTFDYYEASLHATLSELNALHLITEMA